MNDSPRPRRRARYQPARPKTAVRLPLYLREEGTVEGEPATIGRLVRAVLSYDTAVPDSAEVTLIDPDGPFRRFTWDRAQWPRGDWERYVRDDAARKAARAEGRDPNAPTAAEPVKAAPPRREPSVEYRQPTKAPSEDHQ